MAGLAPQALLGARLCQHPACSLIISDHPVSAIWSAHQAGGITTRSGAENVLLTRPQADVNVTVIPAMDAAFLAGLFEGQTIGAAVQAALLTHARFDLVHALTDLCALGAFTASGKGIIPWPA
ncbi:MAG: hypothetical protein MO852_01070 [Candidatus Devosia euplotis]|nr:hypothetical protein [Candidatus Devosia euplotis]